VFYFTTDMGSALFSYFFVSPTNNNFVNNNFVNNNFVVDVSIN